MKVNPSLVLAIVACSLSSAQDDDLKPQALIDLQQLKTALHTKNEVVGRFFKFLSHKEESTTPKPEEKESLLPFLARSFRRLNIFGLQAAPEEPPKNVDGTPCSCATKESNPEILPVTFKPDGREPFHYQKTGPHTFDGPIVNQYPRLSLNDLQGVDPRYKKEVLEQPSELTPQRLEQPQTPQKLDQPEPAPQKIEQAQQVHQQVKQAPQQAHQEAPKKLFQPQPPQHQQPQQHQPDDFDQDFYQHNFYQHYSNDFDHDFDRK